MSPYCSTRTLGFLGWAVLAASSLAFPQAAANGSLEGVLRDSRGLVLPGVMVSLVGPEIIGYRGATTDENGSYRFPRLPAGTYRVTCGLLGYETLQREGIVVATGQAVTLDFVLATPAIAMAKGYWSQDSVH